MCYYVLYLSWNWTKEWIYYLACTNIANKNCVKFCMKEVFKCRERRMMRWDEELTKAQAWGCPCHPNKYPRGISVKAWGCPEAPLLHRQISGHLSRHYIFICFISFVFFLERLYFCFQFSFVLFAVINGLITSCLLWRETRSVFIAKNTLVFTLIVQRVFSFSSTAFSFRFSPWFLFRTC
jgi:hypothetical protein